MWQWAHTLGIFLARKMEALKLILQVTFCTPPGPQFGAESDGSLRIQPIRFYFTDQTKVSRSTRGENSVVQMIGSLLDSIEADYGVVASRLYRAFRPKPGKFLTLLLPTFLIDIYEYLFSQINISLEISSSLLRSLRCHLHDLCRHAFGRTRLSGHVPNG